MSSAAAGKLVEALAGWRGLAVQLTQEGVVARHFGADVGFLVVGYGLPDAVPLSVEVDTLFVGLFVSLGLVLLPH